ncbi:MAG: hypothetical protein ACR2M8_03270 [Pyrinomonadaceae bacterium]|jgi:hypothetical protein|nr:hypothetical protein [Blastocatellia bacterium]MDQ3221825.1 hypothetical protein [Acidobacteriota bacterium]MDQ3490276.1 hypothetical protein [Acidobacteriota bacterium]
MIESTDPKKNDNPPERCTECDREMEHYNTFLSPANKMRIVCWECTSRQEKGFNAKRDFHRGARYGDIPR